MRRVLVAACLTGGLVLTPLPARADSTYQPRTTVGAVAGAGAQHVTVDVPAGTTPTRLAGTLNTDGRLKGTVTILVGEREIATVGDPDPRHIDAPLSAADVVGGALTIGLRYDPLTDNRRCTLPDSSVVTLDHLTLALSGEPAEPTSIGNFFAPGVNAVSVVVPEQASDDILQAGLSAVAALTHRTDRAAATHRTRAVAARGCRERGATCRSPMTGAHHSAVWCVGSSVGSGRRPGDCEASGTTSTPIRSAGECRAPSLLR